MNNKHSLGILMLMFVIIFMLTACTGSAVPTDTEDSTDTTNTTDSSGSGAPNTEGTGPPSSKQEVQEAATRPATQSFELMTTEGNQALEAVLQEGDGFSLYVFEKFTFDPAAGRLSLSSNPDYYVDIELLPADYNVAQLEAAGKDELSQAGKVSDYSGELVEHPLGYAELYLQASGEKGISDYMVWTSEAGDAFLFRLHNPKGEEASDFAGPVLVSLSTVQRDM